MPHPETDARSPEFIPIKEDFFTRPLAPLDQVRLQGSECSACGEVFFGRPTVCQNCTSEVVSPRALSPFGKLWTYTTISYRPPGDYKGPDNPFKPFAVGLVELPEGVRILSLLDVPDFGDLAIGMDVALVVEPLYTDKEGCVVLAYKFKKADARRAS
jgi:hypothetical protein